MAVEAARGALRRTRRCAANVWFATSTSRRTSTRRTRPPCTPRCGCPRRRSPADLVGSGAVDLRRSRGPPSRRAVWSLLPTCVSASPVLPTRGPAATARAALLFGEGAGHRRRAGDRVADASSCWTAGGIPRRSPASSGRSASASSSTPTLIRTVADATPRRGRSGRGRSRRGRLPQHRHHQTGRHAGQGPLSTTGPHRSASPVPPTPLLALAAVLDVAEPGRDDPGALGRRRLRRAPAAHHRRSCRERASSTSGRCPARRRASWCTHPTYLSWRGLARARAAAPSRAGPARRAAVGPRRGVEVRLRRHTLPQVRIRAPAAAAGVPQLRRGRRDGDRRRSRPRRHQSSRYTVDHLAYSPSPPMIDVGRRRRRRRPDAPSRSPTPNPTRSRVGARSRSPSVGCSPPAACTTTSGRHVVDADRRRWQAAESRTRSRSSAWDAPGSASAGTVSTDDLILEAVGECLDVDAEHRHATTSTPTGSAPWAPGSPASR